MSIEASITERAGDSTTVTPYSLFSSDNPGAMITSVMLTGENYNEWSLEMLNALSAKKKKGFIDGSIAKPSTAGADLESWISVKSMVVGWLCTSITPRVRSTVSFIDNAHDLWENLKKRSSVGNKVRVHHLRTQIAASRQDGQSVIDYYGRLAKMWDALYIYKPIPPCSCGAAETMSKDREEEKVHQFIMGLDESRYSNLINSVIDTDPCPSLEQVYARAIREEQRLSQTHDHHQQDAVGFITQRDSPQLTMNEPREFAGNSSTQVLRQRDRLLCSHCGRSGHDKKFCWQITGYPDWWKERNARSGGRGAGRGGRGGVVDDRGRAMVNIANATSPNASVFPELTPEQWKAIGMIAQEKTGCGNSNKLFPVRFAVTL